MELLNKHSPHKQILMIAVIALALNAIAFAASGTWSSTGSMRSARDGQTATLLPSGKVLIAGGTNNGAALASAELYSPIAGTWASTGSMHVARTLGRALLLPGGSVLIVGGCVNDCLSATVKDAEIYIPSSGTFTETGSMLQARAEFAITLLSNGQVLVAGGCTAYNANGCSATTAKAEVYNPATGIWKATAAMHAARHAMNGTLLPSGKVLVAGGATGASDALISSEIYDPITRLWTVGAKMVQARSDYASLMLASGKVLFIGAKTSMASASATPSCTTLRAGHSRRPAAWFLRARNIPPCCLLTAMCSFPAETS